MELIDLFNAIVGSFCVGAGVFAYGQGLSGFAGLNIGLAAFNYSLIFI